MQQYTTKMQYSNESKELMFNVVSCFQNDLGSRSGNSKSPKPKNDGLDVNHLTLQVPNLNFNYVFKKPHPLSHNDW